MSGEEQATFAKRRRTAEDHGLLMHMNWVCFSVLWAYGSFHSYLHYLFYFFETGLFFFKRPHYIYLLYSSQNYISLIIWWETFTWCSSSTWWYYTYPTPFALTLLWYYFQFFSMHYIILISIKLKWPFESSLSTSAPEFDLILNAWDAAVNLLPFAPCNWTEDEITAVLGGQKRPPCPGVLDMDAPDFFAAVEQFTRDEIARVMCSLSANGRRFLCFRGVTSRPSAVAMVWAILRGVDDRDWMRRFGAAAVA